MIIVLYVSKGRKLPLPSRNFDLGACDIIMTSSEPQKLVFLLWAQSKVMETIVNNSFSWGTTKTSFSVKIDNSMTSCNSEGLWRHQTSKTYFCGLMSRPRHENTQLNLQKHFFKKNCYYCDVIQEWTKAWKVSKVVLTPFNLDNILFTKLQDLLPSN